MSEVAASEITNWLLWAIGGVCLAAMFDGVVAMSGRSKAQGAAQKAQAFICLFATHGPWGLVGGGLLLSGAATEILVAFGLRQEVAFFAALLPVGIIAALATWAAGSFPVVRRAKAALPHLAGVAA